MRERLNYGKVAAGIYEAMDALDQYVGGCGLENSLLHLVRLRASQVNGCAYCLDMHWKDLRALGEAEQRLYSLDAWRECPYYTERERAALLWTEAVTRITEGHVPDDVILLRRLPHTKTGKRLEVPVKRILQGADPDAVLNRGAVDDPEALDAIVRFARSRGRRDGT